jgi:hypothetical protein
MADQEYEVKRITESDDTRTLWRPDYSVAPQRVVCAAMYKEGRIVTGARHFDKLMLAQMKNSEGISWWRSAESGFIDQFGDFMGRQHAWQVAEQQGQILREVSSPGTLYSENLY